MSSDYKLPLAFEAPSACRICNQTSIEPCYQGPVRVGAFGNAMAGSVYRCTACGVQMLGARMSDLDEFYASGAYRDVLGQSGGTETYFAIHDKLQFDKLPFLEPLLNRDCVVADVGCGGGSMLDFMSGLAATTIAIEPTADFHAGLKARGHNVYAFGLDAYMDWEAHVDLVTSFSVIEHVQDPVGFLAEQRRLLKPGGRMLISTPNTDELLMQMECESYKAFNYRVVHLYYFNACSLRQAAELAGFSECRIIYKHRFTFQNFATWLAEGRPSGNAGASPLGAEFDPSWRATLEAAGQSDYLYAVLTP